MNSNENTLTAQLRKRFNSQLPPSVVCGIGDDCAVIHPQKTGVQLSTCDLLVEDVHFTLESTSLKELGHKALAVNLSDIAAMGGVARYALLSLALPSTSSFSSLDQFLEGVQGLAEQHAVTIIGGDLSRSAQLCIHLTILGTAEQPRYRHQAQSGDHICVTGTLGDAGAGLRLLQEERVDIPSGIQDKLKSQQLAPNPHLAKGQWLAQQTGVHGMMDISDGLQTDLARLASASGLSAEIFLEDLPLSPELCVAAKALQWDTDALACSSGEDYCLLVTVDPSHFEAVQASYKRTFQEPLYSIGSMTEGVEAPFYLRKGEVISLPQGFDHFYYKGVTTCL